MRFSRFCLVLLALFPLSAQAQRSRMGASHLERVQAVVRAHRSVVNRCYSQAARVRRDTPNHIDMTFVIGPTGQVTRVTFPPIASSFALCSCVARQIQTWQFPPPDGGSTLTVEYPFDF